MTRATSLVIAVLALTAAGLAIGPTEPAGVHAQSPGSSDLAIRNVTVRNATFDAPEPATVVVTIHNEGPNQGSGTLHFRYNATDRPLTGDSRSDQPFNVTDPIPPDETVRFKLDWSPMETQIGPGTVIVTLDSATDPNTQNNRGERDVFVDHHDLRTQRIDTAEHETFPGRWTPYRVLVTNTGNVDLTTNATVLRTTPRSFDAKLPQPSIHLPRGASVELVALVAPPAQDPDELPDGENGTATLRVGALGNPRANTTITLPNTTVTRDPDPAFSYGVTAQLDPTALAAPPDKTPVTGQLEVTNTGNVPDAFALTASHSGAIARNLTVELPVTIVALGPGETGRVPVTVRLDGVPVPDATANVTLHAESVNQADFEPEALTDAYLTVRAMAPNLRVDTVVPPDGAYQADGTTPVEVTVANDGQHPSWATNVSVTVLRGGFPFATAQASLPAIQPGASATATVALPVEELSGAYELDVQVDPDGTVPENREDDNQATSELFVRTAGLDVTHAEGLKAAPGQFVRYEHPPHVFEIRNTGNALEVVQVRVLSQSDWVQDERTLEIPAGAREPVPVSFLVPDHPEREVDRLTVHAQLVNRTSVQAANTTRTTVVDRTPPALLDVTYERNVTATQAFRIETTWDDALGVARASLHLSTPSNATREILLHKEAPDRFARNVTLVELGTHRFTFEAVDRSSFQNRFTHDDPYRVTASYDRAPTVTFPQPEDERTLRAGDPVRVNVHDPAGLGPVRYEAGPHTGVLVEPFEIPTGNWSTGDIQVTVTAENRYGFQANATATFTVDNDPPTIESLSVDPSTPAPDTAFTLTARTSEDTTRVRAELTGSEQRSLTLEPTNPGTFKATLELPEGEHAVTVVAEDGAGNEATAERTIQVGEDGISAPGALLVVGTLAALAAAAARRSPDR